MVDVTFEPVDVSTKPDAFFADFDVVVVVSCDQALLRRVDAACREVGVKFYAGDVVGYFGWAFADLGKHSFTEEVPKKVFQSARLFLSFSFTGRHIVQPLIKGHWTFS